MGALLRFCVVRRRTLHTEIVDPRLDEVPEGLVPTPSYLSSGELDFLTLSCFFVRRVRLSSQPHLISAQASWISQPPLILLSEGVPFHPPLNSFRVP